MFSFFRPIIVSFLSPASPFLPSSGRSLIILTIRLPRGRNYFIYFLNCFIFSLFSRQSLCCSTYRSKVLRLFDRRHLFYHYQVVPSFVQFRLVASTTTTSTNNQPELRLLPLSLPLLFFPSSLQHILSIYMSLDSLLISV